MTWRNLEKFVGFSSELLRLNLGTPNRSFGIVVTVFSSTEKVIFLWRGSDMLWFECKLYDVDCVGSDFVLDLDQLAKNIFGYQLFNNVNVMKSKSSYIQYVTMSIDFDCMWLIWN